MQTTVLIDAHQSISTAERATLGFERGHRARVVEGVSLLLRTRGVDELSEITLSIQQADADDRQAEIAGGFQKIAGHDAKPARIDRQCLAEADFHAEIRNTRQGR